MTIGEKFSLALGFVLGLLFILAIAAFNVDNRRATIIQKYKSGEIVCTELNDELICRSAK